MPGITTFRGIVAGAASLVIISLGSACSSPKPAAAVPVVAAVPVLWGDMKPIVSVKELMRDMIDPLGDYIFDAISTNVTSKGIVERVPTTEADWDRIRMGGVSIAEGAYLLKVRRPFAPEGDLNNSTGPDAVELSPDEITAKVQKDPVEWNARIEALRNVGLEVIDIAKRKDTSELWDAGANLDEACEDCHKSYWYPKEDAAFYRRINKRLDEYVKESSHLQGAAQSPKAKSKS